MKRIIVGLAVCLISTSAFAQLKKPQITGDVVKDTKANFQALKPTPGDGPIFDKDAPASCNFNIFTTLKADTLIAQISTCLQDKLENGQIRFLNDIQAALDSATNFPDQPGVSCLKPGLEIVKAAAGTPGTDAIPAKDAIPATNTTPAVPAVPAVPAIAAIKPGLVLIFQKFREFGLAGGPAACKTWVTGTLAANNPLTQ